MSFVIIDPVGISSHLHHHPALRGVVIKSLIRDGTRQQVAEIRHNDDTAFLKCYLGTYAAQRHEAACARLRQAADIMSGENQVVHPLLELVDCHALIMSQAPGLPMRDVCLTADTQRRRAIVQRAGEWLACLITAREQRPYFVWKWHQKLVEFAATFQFDETVDATLVRQHMEHMKQVTRRLHLQEVCHGVSHGDFHSENIFVAEDGDRLILTGIDMETADPIPVVKDLARMLVWLQIDAEPASDRASGIDRSLFDSLCAPHGPFAAADRLALHFHIGEMLLEFYLRRGARVPEIRRKMSLAIEHWMSSCAAILRDCQ